MDEINERNATKKAIIILHIIRMNRYSSYSKVRKSRLVTILFGVQHNRNSINHGITSTLTKKR